jgi:Cu/Ag efflux protein CusF
MKTLFRQLLTLLALSPAVLASTDKNCGCTCCVDKPKGEACCCAPTQAAKADDIQRHSLRGVVTRIDADRSALMVKHEEIPGVMRAMTMLFKVDAATLASVKTGDTITGLMSRQGSDWVLENVKVTDAKKS